MAWTFTTADMNSQFQRNEQPAQVHAEGNVVAWKCDSCGHPVLFIYRAGKMGSSVQSPSKCLGCNREYHLDPSYIDDRHLNGTHLRASIMHIVGVDPQGEQ